MPAIFLGRPKVFYLTTPRLSASCKKEDDQVPEKRWDSTRKNDKVARSVYQRQRRGNHRVVTHLYPGHGDVRGKTLRMLIPYSVSYNIVPRNDAYTWVAGS